MRVSVAAEKALQTNDTGRIRRADQDRPARAAPDQADPAKNQRAHDPLAEIGFGDQKRAQTLRRNQKRFDVALGMTVGQRDAARKLTELGEKLPRPLFNDRRDTTKTGTAGDGDVAGQHDKHAGADLAGLEQDLAILELALFAEAAHPRNFLRGQRRKCLFVARKRARQARAGAHLASRDGLFRHFSNLPQRTDGLKDIPCCWRFANRLFSRALLVTILRHLITTGRGLREMTPFPGLGLSALEIVAERPLKPLLARVLRGFFRMRPPAIVAFLHGRPCRRILQTSTRLLMKSAAERAADILGTLNRALRSNFDLRRSCSPPRACASPALMARIGPPY